MSILLADMTSINTRSKVKQKQTAHCHHILHQEYILKTKPCYIDLSMQKMAFGCDLQKGSAPNTHSVQSWVCKYLVASSKCWYWLIQKPRIQRYLPGLYTSSSVEKMPVNVSWRGRVCRYRHNQHLCGTSYGAAVYYPPRHLRQDIMVYQQIWSVV